MSPDATTGDYIMSNKSNRKTRAAVTAALQIGPAPLTFASPADFGKSFEVLCDRHDTESRPYREWFLAYVRANFPVISMAKPRKDDSGNAIIGKDGAPVMATWSEYDLKGDDLKELRKSVQSGMLLASVESGAYDSATMKAADALKLAALPKEQRKTADGAKLKEASEISKRIMNRIDANWSRGPLQWLKHLNAEARATATGEKREKSPRFAVLIGKGGKLRKLLERARASSEKAGFADTCSAAELEEALDSLI
jgi:hypothetical protein